VRGTRGWEKCGEGEYSGGQEQLIQKDNIKCAKIQKTPYNSHGRCRRLKKVWPKRAQFAGKGKGRGAVGMAPGKPRKEGEDREGRGG